MAKKKKKVTIEETKASQEGWIGGLSVDLERTMSSGATLRTELSRFVSEFLRQEIDNQADRITAIGRWQRMYKGVRKERRKGKANVAVPIMRSDTDAIFVRIFDAIWNKQKLILARAKKPEYKDIDREIEEAFDQYQRHILKFKEKIFSPLLQCVKTGTGMVKLVYENEKSMVYRRASADEVADKTIKKYNLPGTSDKAVKVLVSDYSGPNMYPIPREDWIISSDSPDIDKAQMCGFKTEYRKEQLNVKIRQGLFDREATEDMFDSGGEAKDDEVKVGRMENQKIERKFLEGNKPFNIWELWLKYDVDEDGEEDEIVVFFNLETEKILKVIYSPIFTNRRPFGRLVFYRQEYAFDGEGVCEILEKPQAELDTMHNQKTDRRTQINSPITFVRAGSGLEDLQYFEPDGKYTIDGEIESCFKEFRFSDATYSLDREEANLISIMDRAVGITPVALGISTAERPVAKQEAILREETNKKFKMGIDNIRDCIVEIVYKIFELFMQYQPGMTYNAELGGVEMDKTVLFPLTDIRNGLRIDLFASTETLNQEVRQQSELMLYHLISDYFTKTAGMVQAIVNPNVPPDFKKFLIDLIKKGDKQIEKIVRDFNEVDTEDYVISLEKNIDIQKALTLGPAPPQPPGVGGGQQPPQGGQI